MSLGWAGCPFLLGHMLSRGRTCEQHGRELSGHEKLKSHRFLPLVGVWLEQTRCQQSHALNNSRRGMTKPMARCPLGVLPRLPPKDTGLRAGARDQSQGHGGHVVRPRGHVGEGVPDPVCCPQGGQARPLGEARCRWHSCPGFLLFGAGTPIGGTKMPLVGQGHPSQGTVTLLLVRGQDWHAVPRHSPPCPAGQGAAPSGTAARPPSPPLAGGRVPPGHQAKRNPPGCPMSPLPRAAQSTGK